MDEPAGGAPRFAKFRPGGPLLRLLPRYSHKDQKERRHRTKKKKPANQIRFRPGTTGACEAQLWSFIGPGILPDDDDSRVLWVAAESLDAALRYMRLRHDDFVIKEARFVGMIPLLSGSPLD
jgi:hypothetical protein